MLVFFCCNISAANDISLSNYKTEWSDEPYVSKQTYRMHLPLVLIEKNRMSVRKTVKQKNPQIGREIEHKKPNPFNKIK